LLALYDVNVLLALFDAEHTQHTSALSWHDANASMGWATCPITQNGLLRIMSQPSYTHPIPLASVADRFRESATEDAHHQFIADDISVVDRSIVRQNALLRPSALTDIYLLALAFKHNARLVTFDRGISISAVIGATPAHLVVL
jgi:toxin-antitoxin system PIN domain toxin